VARAERNAFWGEDGGSGQYCVEEQNRNLELKKKEEYSPTAGKMKRFASGEMQPVKVKKPANR